MQFSFNPRDSAEFSLTPGVHSISRHGSPRCSMKHRERQGYEFDTPEVLVAETWCHVSQVGSSVRIEPLCGHNMPYPTLPLSTSSTLKEGEWAGRSCSNHAAHIMATTSRHRMYIRLCDRLSQVTIHQWCSMKQPHLLEAWLAQPHVL